MIARCAFLCAGLGCTSDVTEVVIVTETDLSIPSELDHVRYAIDARQAGGSAEDRLVALDGPGATALPLRLPLVLRGADLGPVGVIAVGLRDGRPRIGRAVRFEFVRGMSYEIALDLMRDCVAVLCPGDETCAGGRCVPVTIGMPAPGDAGADGGSRDAGTDTGAVDACPSSCGSCEASCDVACRCRRGCSCELSCPSGGRCEDVRCEQDSSCAVRGSDEGTLRVECHSGSSCEVHCGEADVCRVRCRNGADCTLHCAAAEDCAFDECAGGPTALGDALRCAR